MHNGQSKAFIPFVLDRFPLFSPIFMLIRILAPWLFQGIWKILAPMLDPVVRAKVEMTKSAEDLIEKIPKNHLIKKLGGSSAWKWEYPPVIPGENDMQKYVLPFVNRKFLTSIVL